MSKKSHIPLVPRTANYSCALPSRLNRNKTASIQTDRCISPFEIWLETSNYFTEGFVINEESVKTYTLALECVNAFHSHMNKKLGERYGDREGEVTFKFPEVPNYVDIFFLLLNKVKEPLLVPDKEEFKEDNGVLEIKKYVAKESAADSVPEIKQMSTLKILEEDPVPEDVRVNQDDVMSHLRIDDIQTIVHHLRNEDSVICSSNTVSSEFPPFCFKTSSHGRAAEDGTCLDMGKEDVGEMFMLRAVDTDEHKFGKEYPIELKPDEAGVPLELSMHKSDQCDATAITKIIKQHIQKEFVSLFDKHKPKNDSSSRLVQSHFHVINIPPQINLLEYAQKKLERQLTDVNGHETSQKKYVSHPISTRKSLNITSSTPKKVTNMFRKYSQTKFRSLEAVIQNDVLEKESSESDDSVILDDEEFEKINGHVVENSDKKQSRDSSAYNFAVGREKSNPLKLTVRDMSRVNEKVLHTIGLFTERGDVRPGVIDILEEQKKAKAKDVRNKQFRVRRQWDLQVHLRPKDNITSSFASTSSKSFISLSSTDVRSEFATVKNIPQRVIYDK